MNPVQETVLLYYPKKPKYLPKIKSIFVQLGIQFRILDAASTAQKIGYLTGRTGFEKSTSDVPFSKIPQSVLVMDHFSGVRMDVLFSYLKKAGIPSIDQTGHFSHSIRRLQKNMHGCMQEEQSSHVSKSRILDVKDDRMG